MRLRVLFFASLRDLAGTPETTLDFAGPGLDGRELRRALLSRFPALRFEGVRLARNEEFVDEAERYEDGDVVALIPPVSGG